ncbi:hypothetical protein BH09ACT4_BH09ACT4_03420 [soil metagenome]
MEAEDWLFDERTGCWSIQTSMTISDYIDLVRTAHENQGAISGQRATLATTTAKRIRSRMVSDLVNGAVLPPVVIGAVIDIETFEKLEPGKQTPVSILGPSAKDSLSIIDGMQRTAAIIEAADGNAEIAKRRIRVEYWLTTSVRSMIYRMLVLNTGQVPWTISRQLAVVYAPLLHEVEANVPGLKKLISPDNPGRRVSAAQYTSDTVVELYIAFSLRKTSIDTKEQVSDEFSRLDFVDNLADQNFQDQFYDALSMLAELDEAFARFETTDSGRLAKGRHVFDSQPARIGFIVAVGVAVLGRPGADRSGPERVERSEHLRASQAKLVEKLNALQEDKLGDFLRLDVLREVLDRRVGQVGRYERSVFNEAFKVLIDEDYKVKNLEQCWRAE